jgi:phosphoglucomutase
MGCANDARPMPHPLAGKPAPREVLIDPAALVAAYYDRTPDPENPTERVAFGTSGHRGSPLATAFNERHILAMTQAVCDHRRSRGIDGPLFLGKDTHAASAPAERSALEVLAANGVEVRVAEADGVTPTPAVSFAIVRFNRAGTSGLADGIVVTPSHNPPEDGGFKYNPPEGGPADTASTKAIEARANELLEAGLAGVKRIPWERAKRAATQREVDFAAEYVAHLGDVLDLAAVKSAGVRIGVDPLGGAGIAYYGRIAEAFGLDLTVTNPSVDPRFGFMTLDHDGKIRMDCSSPYAMAGLVGLKDRFDVAFGNDADADRHGIVVPGRGILSPNEYLTVAIDYLFRSRTRWPSSTGVGKTVVSSALIDRVAKELGRPLVEVPVGFKFLAPGLSSGAFGFAGEESAGASFLCFDGSPWTTDKDGILLGLLAAEITAKAGQDPGKYYEALCARLGTPAGKRIDAPASPAEKAALSKLSAEAVTATELGGDPITERLTRAPGNGEAIGGLVVKTAQAWFAARPSGTESIYKVYAESFRGASHLDAIIAEAQVIVKRALTAG